jgi:hypothetical protein
LACFATFLFIRDSARLNRLLKNSHAVRFVSGHGSSRATKPFIFVIPSGFSREGSALVPTATSFSAASEAAP